MKLGAGRVVEIGRRIEIFSQSLPRFCQGTSFGGIHGEDGSRSRAEKNALQCGFCTPGMLIAAQDLVVQKRRCSREEIKRHISGNYCRCTGYQAIVDAIEQVLNGQS